MVRKRGRIPLYPWDRWFRAGRFRPRRGSDYVCATAMLAQQIRNEATRRRLSVEVVEESGGLDVTVVGVLAPCPDS